MTADEQTHWLNLIEAMQREAGSMGGFGEIEVRVQFLGGLPKQVDVTARRPRYRLGSNQAPLTGKLCPAILPASK